MAPASLTNLKLARDSRGVVTVTIDVPGRRYNVFTPQVLAELQAVVAWLAQESAIRCVVFCSGKESGFLAGGDLREISALQTRQSVTALIDAGQSLCNQIEALAVPTIAAIHGPCLGGGLEFALACRFRIARNDDATRFGLPEIRLGILPAWGATQRLPELVGMETALQMLLTGRKLYPQQAWERGLVDEVCPADSFHEFVEQFVVGRLEGNPLPRARRDVADPVEASGAAQRASLDTVRRRLERGRHRPAMAAILSAVEEGLRSGRRAGFTREREVFPDLLRSDFSRRRLARFLNRSRARLHAPWVDGLTIGAALRQTAGRFPDRDAAVFSQAGVRLTWAEFDREVDRVARGLLAAGVQHGDHFGIWATNWPEWVLLQFATARIGVVMVTFNPAYRAAEIRGALAQADVRGLALIERHRSSSYFELLREACPELDAARPGNLHCEKFPLLRCVVGIRAAGRPGILTWKDFLAAGEGISPARFEEAQRQTAAGEPINLQYTSGTTGQPKGALLSHRNLLLNAYYAAARQKLDAHDRLCIPVPLYHCFGCVLGTMCSVASGAAMVFPHESFDAEATLRAVAGERCTAIYGVPTMFIAELEHPNFRRYDTSSLRTGIMAGSPCPIELMKRVAHDLGAREITIAYGQTEASPLITMTGADDPIEKRVGTVGRPLPGIEVKIVDSTSGEPLPDGRPGELCARGHDVMLGYYNLPAATSKAIDGDGWLHTGDLGLRQADGYFRITGRLKEMIIRGGENIAPREIEELLYEHPKVAEVAVVGVPDLRFGEEILAWIKLHEGVTATAEEIREYCRERLAHFKTPHYIEFVESFPMTVTGKIQKYKIRQQAIEALRLHDAESIETA